MTKIYKCDPKRNTKCNREDCQVECFFTTEAEYSADGIAYTEDMIFDTDDERD